MAPQKIAFPTDLNLLNEARERTEAMIDAFALHLALEKKSRTYRKLARKNYLSVIRKRCYVVCSGKRGRARLIFGS